MNYYEDYAFKVTATGRDLLAALLATGKGLEITRVAVGSGRVEADQELADMTGLVEYVAEGAISQRKHEGDNLELTVQYASNMTPGLGMFYLAEFVVEAKHPVTGESVNLLYATLGKYIQPVRAYSDKTAPDIREYNLTIAVSSEIEVTVSAVGGLVTYDELNEAVETSVKEALDRLQPGWSVAGSAQVRIPAEGWTAAAAPTEDYDYSCDVTVEGVTSAMTPMGSPLPGYFTAAADAGMVEGCSTIQNGLRFYAKFVPETDIIAKVYLLRMGGSGGGGGDVDPGVGLGWGMDGKLNVLLGAGMSVDEENRISVDQQEVVTAADMLDEDETEQSVKEILLKEPEDNG